MHVRLAVAATTRPRLARRLAVGVAFCLAIAGLMPQPSWAEGSDDASCPSTASVMSGQHALRAMAEGTDLADGLQILAIGSSSTEGVGASSSANTYPSQLESTLREFFPGANVDVRNAGIGGETADATTARLEEILRQPKKPDLVIWQVGTNDAVRGRDEGRFRALLERGIAAVRQSKAALILLDQQFYPAIPDLARYERYVRVVGSAAAAARIGLFSRYKMMKDWNAAGPGVLTTMLSADKFHMGDRGYRCLAHALGHEIASAVGAPLIQSMSIARGKRPEPPPGPVAKRS